MKKFISFILAILILTIPFSACGKDDQVKTVKLNEVTHSVFYAPLYVAIEKGFFEEEGIEIELTNGGGADASMTAVLSGTADVGLMGPETVIYVFNQGKSDAPKVFGQLTQKDGAFLVSKTKQPDFKWTDLKDKEILAGRKGGVPAMTFEYVLNEIGLKDGVDVKLNYDVQFNLMTSAFLGGVGDYCTVFEPTASEYQASGEWYIVASVGAQAGEIPYTSFIALESYIEENSETVEAFLRAIKKAYEFMDKSTDLEIAEAIVKQFPSTSINSIATSVTSYKSIDAWKTDLIATEDSFNRLQDIMINAGELEEKVSYDNLVDNSIAKEVFK